MRKNIFVLLLLMNFGSTCSGPSPPFPPSFRCNKTRVFWRVPWWPEYGLNLLLPNSSLKKTLAEVGKMLNIIPGIGLLKVAPVSRIQLLRTRVWRAQNIASLPGIWGNPELFSYSTEWHPLLSDWKCTRWVYIRFMIYLMMTEIRRKPKSLWRAEWDSQLFPIPWEQGDKIERRYIQTWWEKVFYQRFLS